MKHRPIDRIDACIAAGRDAEAWAQLGALWRQRPAADVANLILSRFPRLRLGINPTPCRLAVLRSYTVEPALPLLKAEAILGGLWMETWVGGFNTWVQEALKPDSDLYGFRPDVILLAVQTRDVTPRLWFDYSALTDTEVALEQRRVQEVLVSVLGALQRYSRAPIVVHALERPLWPTRGQIHTLRAINDTLEAIDRHIHCLDVDAMVARGGQQAWYDHRKQWTSRLPLSAASLPALAREWLRFLHPLQGRIGKVLVTDLDNTIWGGVLEEESAVQVGPEWPGAPFLELQRTLLDLRRRGILLAVASKNNAAAAVEALRTHPGGLLRPEHFAAMRINWLDKAENLRSLACELNVGEESLVFLDDDPVERAWVRQQLPSVTVIELPADAVGYVDAVRRCALLERLHLTSEDVHRGQVYAEQRQRAELLHQVGSIDEFLASLSMVAEVFPLTAAALPRAAQLTQRTNQFNVTARRYSEPELATLLAAGWRGYGLHVRDVFGDNGFTGLALIQTKDTTWTLDTFLLSCRILGRTLETALLSVVVADGLASGATTLEAWYEPTGKNGLAATLFSGQGFVPPDPDREGNHWHYPLSRPLPCPPWIRLERGVFRG